MSNAIRTLLQASIPSNRYVTGWIVSQDAARGIRVDWKTNAGGPVPARTTLSLDEVTVQRAIETQQPGLLVFENSGSELPILIGLVQPAVRAQAQAVELTAPEQLPHDALIDGRRVILEGQDEVVLRCGKASISLRRNGAIVIRGAHVVSHASGVHRIRGGTVQIN